MHEISYGVKQLDEFEILKFMKNVNNDFSPSLDQRCNIKEYSKKLANNAIIIVASTKKDVIGISAFYANDIEKKIAYISFIATLSNYRHLGIASNILKVIISFLQKKGFKSLELEVYKDNTVAVKFYLSKGFKTKLQNETSYFLYYDLQSY